MSLLNFSICLSLHTLSVLSALSVCLSPHPVCLSVSLSVCLSSSCLSVSPPPGRLSSLCLSVPSGGLDVKSQEAALRCGPDVLIATPGRLIDHLHNTPSFQLTSIEILILDEADR